MDGSDFQREMDSSAGYARRNSIEGAEQYNRNPGAKSGLTPPPYGRAAASTGGYSSYPPHYPPSRSGTHPIQSVVTTSFSMDEEREDGTGRHRHGGLRHQDYHVESRDGYEPPHGREPPQYGREPSRYGRDLPPIQEGQYDPRAPQDIPNRSMRVPVSPHGMTGEQAPAIHRSHSAGSYRSVQGPMKRSFWHHAARNEEDFQTSLPNEFMPPKRSKLSPSTKREYVVTARPHLEDSSAPSERYNVGPSQRSPGWFNRAMSWEASREEFHYREGAKVFLGSGGSWNKSPPYRDGPPQGHWGDAPNMPSPRGRYQGEPGGNYGYDTWSSRYGHPEDPRWGPPMRDDVGGKAMRDGPDFMPHEMRRQGTFESLVDGDPPIRFIGGGGSRGSKGMLGDDKKGPIRLLALPEDRISLSETLCLVRENVEVFTATLEDVEAPAPGRKHAVTVGQVGLRCIHCRHTTRSSERVKRAVCYPSSIKRIYRTVIDMKLDHFLHCKFVPDSLKDTLNALKANNTRSTGTTMQYFIRAAGLLGMMDGPGGVRLVENQSGSPNIINQPTVEKSSDSAVASKEPHSEGKDPNIKRTNSLLSQSSTGGSTGSPEESPMPKELFTGQIPLGLPEDKMSLSPLRCFLREQVCAFSATEEDVAVRTPTTFSVSIGQVGIGCVHCLGQPAKSRLNRAVCFPFSIARIYQSVADIQRFHLGECKMVPPEIRNKFLELQSQSSKGSKGLATRQYWVTSAKKLGLVDTSKGLRFGRDPSEPEAKAVSLDILAQVASNVTTVNKPLVLAEDKPFIADFLYTVMEQLQPCRFTEADRNKRRLKDVGCIGVECKHCSGQVDSRKFFWSSVNAVESNFVSVHTHMMECRQIPEPLKENLAELKKLRKEQTAALKNGSQKAFFSRVWKRLHDKEQQKQPEEDATAVVLADKQSDTSMENSVENGDVAMETPPESPVKTEDSMDVTPSIPVTTDEMVVVTV